MENQKLTMLVKGFDNSHSVGDSSKLNNTTSNQAFVSERTGNFTRREFTLNRGLHYMHKLDLPMIPHHITRRIT